ncbi:MAG: heparan-alpha-glucosaminide N-acetyltransferase domain-containing protein, partial [Maribacter sp.]
MKDRIQSVDMFRGATILAMVLVNTPGTWSHVYAPLLHADWHGYTPTDLVFPFFLFIVGTSIVFSYTDRPIDANTYKKIAVRTIKLIVLGIFLGAFLVHYPFVKSFEQIRFPGVLQRIGVVFCITALLFIHVHWKKLVGITACILVGYWALMSLVPVEGMASTLDRAPNNLANWFDVQLFGSHNYKADYDPEGFLSTIPSIASALLGIFTGLILISNQEKKATILMGLGGSLLMIGHFWDLAFPINKALWTSSFVLVTGGWANLILALVYYLTDVRKVEFGAIFK